MSRFLKAVRKYRINPEESELSEDDLQTWGLTGVVLRPYQLLGVQWMEQCMKSLTGCILGDEMGLGKTCQAISLMVYARGCLHMKGPFLVLCPLVAIDNWKNELKRFFPRMSVVLYSGDIDERTKKQSNMEKEAFHILLTNFEICLNDAAVLKRWKWSIMMVDEAQRLKNEFSKLHQKLTEFTVDFRLLITGTPIQNRLEELYSLLSFIQPNDFPPDSAKDFCTTYDSVDTNQTKAEELHRVLQPFLLCRFKDEVERDLPKKLEVVVYHGMSSLQKKFYKAIRNKDRSVFGQHQGKGNQLTNIQIQLRKCVCHPYLFNGVESEPFEIGEHLVEASAKLSLLDAMLSQLHEEGHKVLLFSQMIRMLDILQDYLTYRGYTYERLDGSARAEERSLAIKNFRDEDTFIFLVSTRAGGVSLNLMEADTVIFYDSDYNPQNDLQAESRAHRIGQRRPVKVFRLLGMGTVEEDIYSHANTKLKLYKAVIKSGLFPLSRDSQDAAESSEIKKLGVHKRPPSDKSSVSRVNVQQILGQSGDKQWLIDEENLRLAEDLEIKTHMYIFEGTDYSISPTEDDDEMIPENSGDEGRSQQHKVKGSVSEELPLKTRLRSLLTESELEKRRQTEEENAAEKARAQKEKKQQREEQKHKKKMDLWASCGYKSLSLPSADSEGEDEYEDDYDEEEDNSNVTLADSDIQFVSGDVTHPQAESEDAIIVHCVDDSGKWGNGGLFTALLRRSVEVKNQYEMAGRMLDLDIGNVLLIPIDDKQSRECGKDFVTLIVAQRRYKSNKLSGISLTALEEGLKKIYRTAKAKNASVHLPRIGETTKDFNWYGTERLIRKHLASRGIPTFIYYYKRPAFQSTTRTPSPDTETPSTSSSATSPPEASGTTQWCGLPDFMRGVSVFFYNIGAAERKQLTRHLIAYDGDKEDIMSSQVTHIVAEVESPAHTQELQDMCQQYPHAILVQKRWLRSCFVTQKKLSSSKYILKLE
ncbi:chromodomain-helicase-DNA-binding protein 1-like isoform X1 [Tachysurus fulvidraco]|uniref:chromodomain-helicase-DNA-binding protein 1-like isoform X1 n=2 Tax=Tachysurus fulvidraco TaxID=1234273 RepID=UPI000F5017DC|nr:chromodomain-helicase-DNA-binding protein 1-like isoform X1 [Tachysurus fulvidraco]